MFLHFLSTLDEKSIAKQVYNQQKKFPYLPGLVNEGRELLNQSNVTIDMMEKYSKPEWKRFLKINLHIKNRGEILSKMQQSKKVDMMELEEEEYEMKEYSKILPYNDALIQFRLRGRVLHSVKTHFKNDVQYSKDTWLCDGCSNFIDTSFHILHQCEDYSEERKNIDISSPEEVVKFFKTVLAKREKKRDENV